MNPGSALAARNRTYRPTVTLGPLTLSFGKVARSSFLTVRVESQTIRQAFAPSNLGGAGRSFIITPGHTLPRPSHGYFDRLLLA